MNRSRPAPAAVYTLRVVGRIDPRWFEGLEVVPGDAETLLTGEVVDQAALHGLLARVRDLNLILLSVERQR